MKLARGKNTNAVILKLKLFSQEITTLCPSLYRDCTIILKEHISHVVLCELSHAAGHIVQTEHCAAQ